MVESRTRKAVFLLEAIRALGIPDADVVSTRAEQLVSNADRLASHDLITLRAVRPDLKLLRCLRDLMRPDGQLFLFGRAGELPTLEPGLFQPSATHPLVVSLASQLTVLTSAA
jgi:16S rRNA G527 N7-methylase RsmG